MREVRRVLVEFVLVGAVALAFGLGANAMNRRGLDLTRDYFRLREARHGMPPTANGGKPPATQPHPSTAPGQGPGGSSADPNPTPPTDPIEAVARRLEEEWGLQTIRHEGMAEMYRDERYRTGEFIFIDARNDDEYREGHVPGAFQLDHYYAERYIDTVLAACAGATKVIVYCHGEDCEDSQIATRMLRDDFGVNPSILFVNVGGMKAWLRHRMEVEKGPRNSGEIIEGVPDE